MQTLFVVGALLMVGSAMLFGFAKGDEGKKKLAKFLFLAGAAIGFLSLVMR